MNTNGQTKEATHKTELVEMWFLLKRAGGHIPHRSVGWRQNHSDQLGGSKITKIYYDELEGGFKQ